MDGSLSAVRRRQTKNKVAVVGGVFCPPYTPMLAEEEDLRPSLLSFLVTSLLCFFTQRGISRWPSGSEEESLRFIDLSGWAIRVPWVAQLFDTLAFLDN